MDLCKILNDAGSAFNRVVQQAEERLFDTKRTEYEEEYICNVKKLNILINTTSVLIEEAENMLEPNPAFRFEGKLMEKVDKRSDRNTPFENLGISFDNASHDVKQFNYELYKDFSLCGKYQTKLGEASKEFQNKANEIYVLKLKKMLDIDLATFKEEEESLENLRLDYDSLTIRVKKAITVSGKIMLEKEFEQVKSEFESKLDNNYRCFRNIDQYFDLHRSLLKDFIEAQSKYYMECLNNLEKFKTRIDSHIDKQRIERNISNTDRSHRYQAPNIKGSSIGNEEEIHGDGVFNDNNLTVKAHVQVNDVRSAGDTNEEDPLNERKLIIINSAVDQSKLNVAGDKIDEGDGSLVIHGMDVVRNNDELSEDAHKDVKNEGKGEKPVNKSEPHVPEGFDETLVNSTTGNDCEVTETEERRGEKINESTGAALTSENRDHLKAASSSNGSVETNIDTGLTQNKDPLENRFHKGGLTDITMNGDSKEFSEYDSKDEEVLEGEDRNHTTM